MTNNYFQLSRADRRLVLQQASAHYLLPPQAIEKDLWVTTILQLVFTLPFADSLIFKGGTSLSKVWHLIDRFSEDIDLSIDRTVFGLEGDLTKRQLKKLRKASSVFVREEFLEGLRSAIDRYGLSDQCTLEVEPDGEGDSTYPEPRKLFVKYISAWPEPLGYLEPVVTLEVGARSMFEPNEKATITSLVETLFSSIRTTVTDSKVTTAVPGKTFLEKAFLLHELFSIEGHGTNANRKSRHLYDLFQMMDKDFAIDAVKDSRLWESIRHHREIFTSVKGMDYTPDIRRRIVLIPRPDIMTAWENDYSTMASAMIYGHKPSFHDLLSKLRELEHRFHTVSD